MLEKPDIDDENTINALHENYSIQVDDIEFLPIGNDPSAFAYRVEAKDGEWYFLKLKKRLSNPAGLFVPRFLKDNGIEQVFLAGDAGETTKRDAVEGFMKLFSRDDVVEAALNTAVEIVIKE